MLLRSNRFRCVVALVTLALLSGCSYMRREPSGERATQRDKTKKGAAIGAGVGAVYGLLGEGELDEVLVGAAIGAGLGAGVGAYMDRQEEKLAQVPGTTVERVDEETILLHFESDLLFDVNSAILSSTSRANVQQAARVFMDQPKTAIIAQGHTDSTGSEVHNQALSERRADAVADELIAVGVDPARIVSIGYGESHPVADNGSPQGRRKNRRVDLLLRAKRK